MKTIKFLVAAVMMVCSTVSMAQDQQSKKPEFNREQYMQMMWQKKTQRLMLTSEQADKLAPVYKEYVAEMIQLRAKCGAKKGGCKPGECKAMTEAEKDKCLKERLDNQRKRADIQEKYYNKFRKIANADQSRKLLQLNCPKHGKCGKMKGKHGKKNFKKGGRRQFCKQGMQFKHGQRAMQPRQPKVDGVTTATPQK